MLLSHLSTGYLLGRAAYARGLAMAIALLGAIAPDIDTIWWYFTGSTTHHHLLPAHIPAVWAVIAAIILPLIARLRPANLYLAIIFFIAVFLHLALDTISGGIMWLWPFSDYQIELITLAEAQTGQFFGLVWHWTVALELMVWTVALATFLRSPDRPG